MLRLIAWNGTGYTGLATSKSIDKLIAKALNDSDYDTYRIVNSHNTFIVTVKRTDRHNFTVRYH